MRIRPVRATDADALAGLLGRDTDPRRWTGDPARAAYVADDRGDLLGVVAVEHDGGGLARIVGLVVADHALGIGSRLVATAESFATAHGCHRIEYLGCAAPECSGRFRQAADPGGRQGSGRGREVG